MLEMLGLVSLIIIVFSIKFEQAVVFMLAIMTWTIITDTRRDK